MLIDFHTHIFPPSLRASRERHLQKDATLRAMYSSPKARMASAEELIADMDVSGVERAVVMGPGWNDPSLAREANDYIIQAAGLYPNRLVGFCSVNPAWGKEALEEVERCASLGLKGIGELHPDTQGFQIDGQKVMSPLMELTHKLEMPVLVHSSEPVGHQYPGKGRTTPDRLCRFVLNFPHNAIVCAHWGGGLPFYALMPEVAQALHNVYFDTAASPLLYRPSVYSTVARLVGPEKVLFGSDFPLLDYQSYFREIESAPLSQEDRGRIMGGNALALLGLG